eukprot:4632108-Amphidinium_carterae.1
MSYSAMSPEQTCRLEQQRGICHVADLQLWQRDSMEVFARLNDQSAVQEESVLRSTDGTPARRGDRDCLPKDGNFTLSPCSTVKPRQEGGTLQDRVAESHRSGSCGRLPEQLSALRLNLKSFAQLCETTLQATHKEGLGPSVSADNTN